MTLLVPPREKKKLLSDYTIVWSKTPVKVIKPDSKPLPPHPPKRNSAILSASGGKAEAAVIQIQEVMAL